MRALSFSIRAALLWSLALLASCVDSYLPDVIKSPKSYLVVDGYVNSNGITTVSLSRTYAIGAKSAPPVETAAIVNIEDEAGTRYPLRESTVKGTYSSSTRLVLNPAKKYRLRIFTTAGKDYASDYAPVKNTPAIDNLTWQATDGGLNIYVNTHDDANQTRYYRWEYEDTWEIVPIYFPTIEYVNGAMRSKLSNYVPRLCWGSGKSVTIQQTNTTRLSRDVVSDYVIRAFAPTASQLYSRYSILVRQYAQTAEEYTYREVLRKNTENIGTLFDPLPAQLTGNVHCLNDEAELALGFVGVTSVAEKRIFIQRSELPAAWRVPNGYESCSPPDIVDLYPAISNPPTPAEIIESTFRNPDYLPIDVILGPEGQPVAYLAKFKDCIDCRTRGTAVKPTFWP